MSTNTTVQLTDDKDRTWTIDVELHEGTDDFIYSGQWFPGDDPEIEVLGAEVEFKSGRTLRVGPETVEKYISLDRIEFYT